MNFENMQQWQQRRSQALEDRHGPSKIRCPLEQHFEPRVCMCVFHSGNKTSFFAGQFRKKNRAKIWESFAGGGLPFRNERYKMILRCAPVLHEWLHDHALACCNGWVPMPGCILPKYLWQHVYGIQAVQAWQRPTWNPVEHPPSTSRPPLININFMEKIVPNAGQRHSFRFGRDACLPLFCRSSRFLFPLCDTFANIGPGLGQLQSSIDRRKQFFFPISVLLLFHRFSHSYSPTTHSQKLGLD